MMMRWVGVIVFLSLLTMPVMAAPPPNPSGALDIPRTFFGWCQKRSLFEQNVEQTITTILHKIGTTDCQKAQTELRSITALRITALHPYRSRHQRPQVPYNYLSLDMPFAKIDLRPIIAAMPNLQQIDLSNTMLIDIGPLGELNHLEDLNLANTELTNIDRIFALTSLVRLNISHNQIQDLSPLRNSQWLQHLDFSHNQIRDLSVLAVLPKLRSIRLTNNPVDASTCSGKWTSACEP